MPRNEPIFRRAVAPRVVRNSSLHSFSVDTLEGESGKIAHSRQWLSAYMVGATGESGAPVRAEQ